MHLIGLVTRCRYCTLPRATALHFATHKSLVDDHPCRIAIEHTPDCSAVRLTKRSEPQQRAKAVHCSKVLVTTSALATAIATAAAVAATATAATTARSLERIIEFLHFTLCCRT